MDKKVALQQVAHEAGLTLRQVDLQATSSYFLADENPVKYANHVTRLNHPDGRRDIAYPVMLVTSMRLIAICQSTLFRRSSVFRAYDFAEMTGRTSVVPDSGPIGAHFLGWELRGGSVISINFASLQSAQDFHHTFAGLLSAYTEF